MEYKFLKLIFLLISIRKTVSLSSAMSTPTRTTSDGPVWCEKNQIYIGGVPENEEVKQLINESYGHLRIFGYGSLCWNPGTEGGLSKASQTLGQVRGYKRVWAQRSTDHRGTVDFPGIVCTLLTEEEYKAARKEASSNSESQTHDGTISPDGASDTLVTQGIIFDVPPELVDETLQDLDFREKGGYARDVCTVVEEETQKTYRALLYRGTPDNPAFSSRALIDLPLSAAIMSVSIGPSGPNDVYLNNLVQFLAKTQNTATQNDDTTILADMLRSFQNNYRLYFLTGGGSNQHNQLFLNRPNIVSLIDAGDAHLRKDIVLPTPLFSNDESSNCPKAIYAGGGHSGLLTKEGKLFLWGWNKDFQCGMQSVVQSTPMEDQPLSFIRPLENIDVEKASFGFSHTLVIEKESGKLFAFGNDERGQVTGRQKVPLSDIAILPMTPDFLQNEVIEVADAGLFHSAAVTKGGELITFGCNRFGQSNLKDSESTDQLTSTHGRWKPDDGERIVGGACGRRHTIAVDSLNRIWTFGENKHGQLGRKIQGKKDPIPTVLDMEGKIEEDDNVAVYCGWSHTIIHAKGRKGNRFFGFGRNDKGQLGTGSNVDVKIPIEIFSIQNIKSVRCGSESTMVIDDKSKYCNLLRKINTLDVKPTISHLYFFFHQINSGGAGGTNMGILALAI